MTQILISRREQVINHYFGTPEKERSYAVTARAVGNISRQRVHQIVTGYRSPSHYVNAKIYKKK